MLPSYLLSLREGIEAALIIGILLGALRRMRRTELSPAVWMGVAGASVLSLLSGVLLTAFGLGFEGKVEAIFEGSTMLLAAGILTWMIFWMDRQARTKKGELESGVHRAVFDGGYRALSALAFLAILREGIELALFLVASLFASNIGGTVVGAILGLGTAVLLGWSLFVTTVRLDLRRFFRATGFLLVLFAAGLVAHGVREFNEAGWIPPLIEHVWNLNGILDENSLAGSILKALFGYNGNPSFTEVLAYVVYYLAIYAVLRYSRRMEVAVAQGWTRL
jgi:high-affinity iron transporter